MTNSSMLTTVYNGREYLFEAIESLLYQTLINFYLVFFYTDKLF